MINSNLRFRAFTVSSSFNIVRMILGGKIQGFAYAQVRVTSHICRSADQIFFIVCILHDYNELITSFLQSYLFFKYVFYYAKICQFPSYSSLFTL